MLQHKYIRYTLFISFIASLSYGFSSYTMQEPIEQQTDRCSMCWETMPQEQDMLVQLSCHPSHIFHKPCLESWLNERIQQNQTLACLYCNQALSIEDRAKLNINEVQAAPVQAINQAAINEIQQAFQDLLQPAEQRQLIQQLALARANGQLNENEAAILNILLEGLEVEEEQEDPHQPKEVQIRIAWRNAKAHLPPLEQLLESMKEEVYKILGPSIPQETIERFMAQLPHNIQHIRQSTDIMLNRQDIEDIHQHQEEKEQLYRALFTFIKDVLNAYIQVFNIQHIPYEQSHIHFTLIGRIVTLLSIHALPAVKLLLKDIRAIEAAHEDNDNPQLKDIIYLQSILDPLTDQDIPKLIKTLFTVPLDRHNWNATKALIANAVNQLQAGNIPVNIENQFAQQFAQLNPKVQEALKSMLRQHKYLLLKKNIMHKLNNPWIRGVVLTLCSAIVAKLCQHIHKALL